MFQDNAFQKLCAFFILVSFSEMSKARQTIDWCLARFFIIVGSPIALNKNLIFLFAKQQNYLNISLPCSCHSFCV